MSALTVDPVPGSGHGWDDLVRIWEETDAPEVSFNQDLYTAFYGQREFSLTDPDGIDVNFFQPLEQP